MSGDPANFQIKEVRFLDQATTMTTAFTSLSDATWDAATKIRVHEMDLSGLTRTAEVDPSVQTRLHHRNAPIRTITGGVGDQSFSFRMYLEGGSSSAGTVPTVATLLHACLGGLKSPSVITDEAETGTTSTDIVATAHAQVAGAAEIVGVRGDGRGGGKVGVVVNVSGADDYEYSMALPGTPNAGDAIKRGHTVYLSNDPNAIRYIDFCVIGSYAGSGATDDPDQLNIIGCGMTCAFGGLAPGELPYVEFTARPADWRDEPNTSKASFTHTVALEGNDPAGTSKAIGVLTLGDTGTTTRNELSGGSIEIEPNLVLEAKESPNGVNGVEGWTRTRSDDGVMVSLTTYWDDMPGLTNDFTNGTAKQLCFAMGHESQDCVAISLPNCYLREDPHREEIRSSMGLRLMMEAASIESTDLSTDDYDLEDSPFTITFL